MFEKIISGAQQFISGVRQFSDKVLDSTIEIGIKTTEEKINAMNEKSKHTFFLSVCFDMIFIVVAVVCLIFHFKWALSALWAIGATKLLWTLVRFLFAFNDLKPHWELIKRFAPIFANALIHYRSLEKAIQMTIRGAFQFFYGEKLTTGIKTAHKVTSLIGATPSAQEIEDKAVASFYPPLHGYIRRLLLINVMCFIGFYGILMGIVKFYLMRWL